MKQLRTLAIAATTVLALSLAACKRPDSKDDSESKENIKVPVEVATAVRSPVTAAFQGTSNLVAEAESEVAAKTSGVVMEIFVEEGDLVRAGQVLARLDSDRQRLSLKQSEANLRKLENDYQRQQEMFNRKLISQDVFDRSRFDLDTQRAAFDMSKLELSYAEIRAPIEGVVSRRDVKVGNLIQINQTLFKIDDFDPLEAVINVPEREMRLIAADQPVQMLVDALPGQVFVGGVARVSPVVDATTGTFRVIAQFRDESKTLRSGMFGRVRIVYDQRNDALVVPRAALIGDDQDAALFVVDGDTAKRRKVTLGYSDNGKVEVIDGVSEGEMVVTLGQAALRDGVKVEVINAPASAVATSTTPGT